LVEELAEGALVFCEEDLDEAVFFLLAWEVPLL
jgi:hypothetical protein